MFWRVYAGLVHASIALIIPVSTHESEVTMDEHGNLDVPGVESGKMATNIMSAARYIIMRMLYGPLYHCYCCRRHDEWAEGGLVERPTDSHLC